MTSDKITNPHHFRSDPADIRIRIRINQEIRIRVPEGALKMREWKMQEWKMQERQSMESHQKKIL